MKVLDRKLLRDLGRMKGQVITIAIVVACGIAVFVSALSTYDSLWQSQQDYYATARFAQVFAHVKRAPTPLVHQVREIPGIAEVEPRLVYEVTLDVPGVAAPVVGRMIGVPTGGQPTLNRLYLRRGRLIDAARAHEVVISEGFALANHLNPGDQIAAILNGRRQELEIVGVVLSAEYVYAIRAGDPLPDNRQFGIVWINHDTLASAFTMEGAFNNVVLTLAPRASEPAVLATLDRLFTPYGGLGAYGRDHQLSHLFLSEEIRQQEVMATTMPPIFLAVAIFLLHVVLGRIVTGQREQIAALKALGYDNLTVGLHYLKLGCLIVMVGSLFGVVLGAWLGRLMTANYVDFFRFPILAFRVQPWLPLLGIGVGLLSALVATVSAVRRVMVLTPAEAMRPPAPPRYRHTLIERLGFVRWLSPQGRMVLRHIGLRPGRALMTTVGIALAVPILVLAFFWQDAIAYMMTVQFFAIDRGDATVTFTEPVTRRALREIEQLPGVMQVEGVRAVPVRVWAGHQSYRTAVQGLPPHATLRRVLNDQLQPIPIPTDGLLLTDRLGERLGLRPGDRVVLEALEGTRVRREVEVTQLVNDIFGMSAYMEIHALNRLMSEGEAISSVSVAVDPAHEEELYARLKQLPKVATVSLKRRALASFRETVAKFVLVFTGILTVFAVAIAVGVVYNNARVALAERAWELASLRVLGFTRAEVSTMLLNELAIELLAAIPFGLWLGYWFVVAIGSHHQAEMFRIPAVIAPRSYALAALVILLAGVGSALIVRHRIDHLDLVSVLKTRE
ncbi:MAG: FtsX-like permease family protein [Deltaproteobacteria bacterium]|nr:FtsX-like permease family protein [Deltaproteobacteria bacterium]